jgi:uncharacterized protein (DUF2384 family)
MQTYWDWIAAAEEQHELLLPAEVLMRISRVLSVYAALENLFCGEAERADWLRRPHGSQSFGGRPPIDLLTSGEDTDGLALLRFLKAAETGIHMEPNEVDHAFPPYEAVHITDVDEAN